MTSDDRAARAARPAADALRLHAYYRGKIQSLPKCAVRGFEDFAIWYTPGVAAPCRAIVERPEAVYEHTNRGNSIAVVSDGSRVLGLGNIGPEAGLPVMEGKALLFKYLGGVDAVPLCLGVPDAEALISVVEAIAPTYGAINLEDIAQPKCFRVLSELKRRLPIPVWHDDQQGTATVVLGGLLNALEVVGKRLDAVRIALVGVGAANVANYRLLVASGVDPRAIVACDSRGILHRGRADLDRGRDDAPDKWRICEESNGDGKTGGILEALRGADVCLAFSQPGPDTIAPEAVRGMNAGAVAFLCANPVPELWPWLAEEQGVEVVATGRSDFPNQVNNSLGFPGIFRGVLDVRARAITDEMAIAAALELAAHARETGLSPTHVLPRLDDERAHVRVAVATGTRAIEDGLAACPAPEHERLVRAQAIIASAKRSTLALMSSGAIPPAPQLDRG